MKAYMYKSWDRLPPSEKLIIAKLKEQEMAKGEAKLQKHWIILDCIVDHDYMGRTPEEILLKAGNWCEVYRLNSKFKTEEEQLAWFDQKLTEIFGDPKILYDLLDKMENIGQ